MGRTSANKQVLWGHMTFTGGSSRGSDIWAGPWITHKIWTQNDEREELFRGNSSVGKGMGDLKPWAWGWIEPHCDWTLWSMRGGGAGYKIKEGIIQRFTSLVCTQENWKHASIWRKPCSLMLIAVLLITVVMKKWKQPKQNIVYLYNTVLFSTQQ